MDIIAHALWTTAAAATGRRKLHRRIHLGWAAFWGIFPDLFSFAIPAVVRIWWYATGTTRSLLPDAHGPKHFQFVWQLYHFSQLVLVFGWMWVRTRRADLVVLAHPKTPADVSEEAVTAILQNSQSGLQLVCEC